MWGEEWASQWDTRAGLPSLMTLCSSDPPAAQVPALSQRQGCSGDLVTVQPQVSHRTFGPS